MTLHCVEVFRTAREGDVLDIPHHSSLRRLRLTHIPSGAYTHILRRLTFPHCTSFKLEPDPVTPDNDAGVPDTFTPYRHDTPSFAQHVGRALRCAYSAHIMVEGPHSSNLVSMHVMGTEGGRDKKVLDLALRGAPQTQASTAIPDTLRELAEVARAACPTISLQLSVCVEDELLQLAINGLSDAGVSVQKLSLSGVGAQAAMQLLGSRPIDGAADWPYPELQLLDLSGLSGKVDARSIRRWVRDRWVINKHGCTGLRPPGSVEVIMPIVMYLRWRPRKEYWKPNIGKSRSDRRAPHMMVDVLHDEWQNLFP